MNDPLWNKTTHFIVTSILSLFYLLVAILNLIQATHTHLITIKGPIFHPFISLVYLLFSLLISWGLYFYFRTQASKFSFLLMIIVGIVLIFSGLFLWRLEMKFDDVVIL